MKEKKDDLMIEIKEIEKMNIEAEGEREVIPTINGGCITLICC